MVKSLFVPKQFGTYADTFLMLGLAQLTEAALRETDSKTEILLKDAGTHYQLELKAVADLTAISQLTYRDPFPVVFGQKTDISKLPIQQITSFDVVKNSEQRKRFRDYQFQNRKSKNAEDDAPDPPDPRTQNGAILTSMRHDRNHNDLWLEFWQLKDDYGVLVATILEVFSEESEEQINQIYQQFEAKTGHKLPTDNSAVKIYFPTSVQGVSATKADKNTFSSQKIDGLSLWLIAGGFFQLGFAERVKVAESVYDWRVVALEPHDITLSQYRNVLQTLRVYNPPSGGHGIARFDAELVLNFAQELLNYHPAKEQTESIQKRRFSRSVKDLVSGFRGTHFGSKGQVYGVKDVFSLGLPSWVRPSNLEEIKAYSQVLDEHLRVVRSLSIDEGHSELLGKYRDFITGDDLLSFFRFIISYGDYITASIANKETKTVPQFSIDGLNLMVKYIRSSERDWSLTEITENPGFLNIAKAINSATVYAGKDEKGWERIYGLAQRLSSQSGSKKEFVTELTAFLASYENENLRLEEKLKEEKKHRRIWVTKQDLDQLIALIDDPRFGCALVANLLIAYGYAKGWGKPAQSQSNSESISESTNDSLTEGETEHE